MFIIAVCAVPVLRSFVLMFNQQKDLVHTIHVDHFAHLAFAKAAEELYSLGAKGISIKELIHQERPVTHFYDAPNPPYGYQFFYYIDIDKPATKQDTSEKLLLNVTVKAREKEKETEERQYLYKLYVSQKNNKLEQAGETSPEEDKKPKNPFRTMQKGEPAND